jgi:hypothetical protein
MGSSAETEDVVDERAAGQPVACAHRLLPAVPADAVRDALHTVPDVASRSRRQPGGLTAHAEVAAAIHGGRTRSGLQAGAGSPPRRDRAVFDL